ncbi:MgtC/SapB family protein [Litorivivens sp.]|uniref:MgtC/SapB family protein n=1 Tax=Litorivivens sp. TaxID=2020868 RepID=UPI0035653C76
MSELPDIRWTLVYYHLLQLAVAYILALPIGWDREAGSRGVGLRTFPLVAAGCCGYLLIGLEVLSGSEAYARLMYGLMSGIGFIGGGAILKTDRNVSGTATAAAIWSTGAIGTAVAFQRYEIAISLSLVTYFTLRFTKPLKRFASRETNSLSPQSSPNNE